MRTLQGQKEEIQNISCPRCGGEASWQASDEQAAPVTVQCGDCGHFEISRADLERLAQDAVWPEADDGS